MLVVLLPVGGLTTSGNDRTCAPPWQNVQRTSSAFSTVIPAEKPERRDPIELPPPLSVMFALRCCNNAIECRFRSVQVENIVQQEDVCNLFLISDRRLKQVFFKDVLAQGAISDADEAAEEHRELDPFEEAHQKESAVAGTVDGTAHQRPGEGPCDGAPQPPGSRRDRTQFNTWGTASEPPAVGDATRSYVEEALPEMERLSQILLR